MRGDQSSIEVGIFTNVQDRVVINTVPELKSGFSPNVEIGNYCSIGQGSILTSCVVESYVTVGPGTIISEGCILLPELSSFASEAHAPLGFSFLFFCFVQDVC